MSILSLGALLLLCACGKSERAEAEKASQLIETEAVSGDAAVSEETVVSEEAGSTKDPTQLVDEVNNAILSVNGACHYE